MKKGLVSKILANGLAAAVAFGAFSSSAFAVKTQLHEMLEKEGLVNLRNFSNVVCEHPEWINEKDEDGGTPAELAAKNGHLKALKCLIQHGADVDYDGLLSLAVEGDKLDVVRCLVGQYHADVSYNILCEAVECSGDLAMLKCLIEEQHGSKYSYDYDALLLLAAESGNWEIVKYLVEEKNADANYMEEDCRGPSLLVAARSGNFDMVKFLMGHGATAEYMPLYDVAAKGYWKIVRYLVKRGAEAGEVYTDHIQQRCWDRPSSILIMAIKDSDIETVKCLVRHGANVNFEAVDGDTPLKMAKKVGNAEIITYLQAYGAKDK